MISPDITRKGWHELSLEEALQAIEHLDSRHRVSLNTIEGKLTSLVETGLLTQEQAQNHLHRLFPSKKK